MEIKLSLSPSNQEQRWPRLPPQSVGFSRDNRVEKITVLRQFGQVFYLLTCSSPQTSQRYLDTWAMFGRWLTWGTQIVFTVKWLQESVFCVIILPVGEQTGVYGLQKQSFISLDSRGHRNNTHTRSAQCYIYIMKDTTGGQHDHWICLVSDHAGTQRWDVLITFTS